MAKKLIFSLLGIFLFNINLVIAHHEGVTQSSSQSSFGTIILLLVLVIAFILIIWFFRKSGKDIGKKE